VGAKNLRDGAEQVHKFAGTLPILRSLMDQYLLEECIMNVGDV
jgi:hypothetical protein